jgi:chitodextrinase
MNNQRIGEEQIIPQIDTVFTTLDRQRTQGLERLQQMQTIQNTALQQEQKRLIAKYGEDHPRVQKINARLTYNQGVEKDLNQEIERSQIEVRQFDPNTWKGHGLVLDKNEVGIQGLTVSFADQKGNWIRELGYACTDKRGYFTIVYPPKTGQSASIPDSQPIFLTVTDPNRRLLHRECTPRYFKIGQIEFWRIILGDDDNSCETPPDDPDATAVRVLSIDGPEKLAVNQSGSFTAKVNDDATPPITSRWNFGDGTTADGLTATHSYTKPETYTVTFTASNRGGEDAKEITVTVRKTSVLATIETLVATPMNPDTQTPVRFNAKIEENDPISYSWDFGDNTSSTEVNPSHTYNRPGVYRVTLTVSHQEGSDSRSLSILIAKPDPDVWLARGRVADEKGQGIEGLVVSLYDRDLAFDDRLGTSQTDVNGDFAIAYRTEDFQDLFEAHPDLYIKIMDSQGNLLYSSENTVRCQAGRVEVFNITIGETEAR